MVATPLISPIRLKEIKCDGGDNLVLMPADLLGGGTTNCIMEPPQLPEMLDNIPITARDVNWLC